VAKLIEQRFQLGLSHGSIARIERGEQRLSVGMLAVLCSIYDVPPIEVAVGLEARDDAIWHTLVRAGLKEEVVAGVVWLEQMLDHGYAKLRRDGTSPPTAAAD
jgi:transcriptional regulator with XRE-family HTH domain